MNVQDEKIIPTLDDVIKPGDLDKAVLGELSSIDDEIDAQSIELFSDAAAEMDDAFDDEFDKIYAEADLEVEVEAEATELETVDDELRQPEPEVEAEDSSAAADSVDEISADFEINAPDDADSNPPLEALAEQPDAAAAVEPEESTDSIDDIADLIVEEQFSDNDPLLLVDEADAIDLPETENVRAHDVASWGEPVVRFEDANDDEAPEAPAPVTATAPTTEIAPAPVATQAQTKLSQAAAGADINVGQLVDDITEKLMPEIEWKIRMRLREILDELFPEN